MEAPIIPAHCHGPFDRLEQLANKRVTSKLGKHKINRKSFTLLPTRTAKYYHRVKEKAEEQERQASHHPALPAPIKRV